MFDWLKRKPADPNDPHRGCPAFLHDRFEKRVNGRLVSVEIRCGATLCYKPLYPPDVATGKWIREEDRP